MDERQLMNHSTSKTLPLIFRMEVTVAKGRGGVTLTLTLKDGSYH